MGDILKFISKELCFPVTFHGYLQISCHNLKEGDVFGKILFKKAMTQICCFKAKTNYNGKLVWLGRFLF